MFRGMVCALSLDDQARAACQSCSERSVATAAEGLEAKDLARGRGAPAESRRGRRAGMVQGPATGRKRVMGAEQGVSGLSQGPDR